MAVVAVMAASSSACSPSEPGGQIYRVAGTGTSCDRAECGSDELEYELRLVPADSPSVAATRYVLADTAERHKGLNGYPECLRVAVHEGRVTEWVAATCP